MFLQTVSSSSSLTSFLEDYKTLIAIVPQTQPLYRDSVKTLKDLEPRIEVTRQRDIDKMMGQLKTVGNSVLGKPGPLQDSTQEH